MAFRQPLTKFHRPHPSHSRGFTAGEWVTKRVLQDVRSRIIEGTPQIHRTSTSSLRTTRLYRVAGMSAHDELAGTRRSARLTVTKRIAPATLREGGEKGGANPQHNEGEGT